MSINMRCKACNTPIAKYSLWNEDKHRHEDLCSHCLREAKSVVQWMTYCQGLGERPDYQWDTNASLTQSEADTTLYLQGWAQDHLGGMDEYDQEAYGWMDGRDEYKELPGSDEF